MSALRVFVVGAGFIARKWIDTIASQDGVTLAGVGTRSPERGAAAVQAAGLGDAPVVQDWPAWLSTANADAVIVTLPQHLHPDGIVAALDRGCHVLVEKPLAVDASACRVILDAARAHADRVVMVNQNFRWRPHVQALRHAVRSGMVGDVGHVMFECRQQIRRTTIDGWRERMAEPYLLDFAIHHFDLLRYVIGDEPQTVSGRSFRPAWSWFDGHSAAHAWLTLRGGAQVAYAGTMVSNGCETPQEGVITVIGPSGTLRLEHDSVVRLTRNGETTTVEPVPVPGGEFGYALAEFASAIAERRAPEVDLDEHLRSLGIVFAIMESARTGTAVEI